MVSRAGVALVAVAALVGPVAIATPAAAESVVLSADFDDGTAQGWIGSYGSTVAPSTTVAHSSPYSLLTGTRTGASQGPERVLSGAVQARVKYSYTVFARMAAGAAAANLHMTAATWPDVFVWVTAAPLVDANGWVQLSGTSTLNFTPNSVYVESGGGQLGSFFIDDVRITQLPPAAPVITSPTEGTVTANRRPVISGTSDPLNSITVTRGGTTICTATADASGNWSCTPTADLIEGYNDLMPTARDGLNVATPGYPVTVILDTIAPTAPTITSPGNGAALAASPRAISGSGEAFTTVTVTEGGTTVCTATVAGNGTWSCTPSQAFGEGSHTLTPRAVDRAGNATTGPATTFTVDTTPPAVPVITGPTLTNDPTPTISGTGDPGTTVTVMENGTALCTATVAAGGTWSCTPTTPLADGVHRFTPVAKDLAGNTATGPAVLVTIDATPPVVPVITSPTQGSVISDTTPTFTGTGETGTTITIYDGSTPICSVPIEVCGHWTCTPTTALAVGSHTLTPRAQDLAGNISTGASVTFTITLTVVKAQVVDRRPPCSVR